MIIKLDHIAVTCYKKDIRQILSDYKDYQISFSETSVSNSIIKKELMSEWVSDHDIILVEKDDAIPIEITAYESIVSGIKKYELNSQNTIVTYTGNKDESENFYKSIGFKADESGSLCIKPAMGFSPISLELIEKPTDCYRSFKLNYEGFCCLAFVVNSSVKEKERLDKAGIKTTEIDSILLHERTMKIFFAYNEQGDFCEFIGLK